MKSNLALFIFTLLIFNGPAFSHDIVVTSRPIYSIIKNISCDLKVKLIGNSKISPHDMQLRPSELKMMQQAKLIVITSPNLEGSLYKLVNNHDLLKNKILLVQETPDLNLKPYQHHEEVDGEHHHHSHHEEMDSGHHHHSHHHHGVDPHFWLEIENAKKITNFLAEKITVKFPKKEDCIKGEAARFIETLDQLQAKLDSIMAKSKNSNIIISHDALSYFFDRYNIKTAGVVISNFHTPPTLKHISKIKKLAESKKVQCVLIEERFNSTPIKNAFSQANINQAFFDAEWGLDNVDSKNIYSEIMLNNARAIADCAVTQPAE